MEPTTISRRALLTAAAGTAAAVTLAACGNDNNTAGSDGGGGDDAAAKGSAKTPLAKPGTLNESPTLAELVKAGSLPAIDDRVGPEPYVIPHNWVQKGKYGGSLRMMATKSTDGALAEWWYAHSPVRFLNDGADIGPGMGHQVGVQRRRQRVDLHAAQGHQVVRRPPGHHRRHHVLVERHDQLQAGKRRLHHRVGSG